MNRNSSNLSRFQLRYGILVLMLVAALGYCVGQGSSFSTPSLTNTLLSHQMISLASSAMTRANQTLQYAHHTGMNQTLIIVAEAHFHQGRELVLLANATLYQQSPAPPQTWGNKSLVNQLALDALHQFQSTIVLIAGEWDESALVLNWRSLHDTIQRYYRYLHQLETTIQAAQITYPDTDFTLLRHSLQEAKQHLDWAQANMTTFHINQTQLELDAATNDITQINRELKAIARSGTMKGELITQFIISSRMELQAYQATALQIGINIDADAAAIAMNLDAAQELTDSGDLEGAMTALRDAYDLLLDLDQELTREKSINE